MKQTKVTLDAKFPQMRPAHNAYISTIGEGSNFDRAVRNGIQKIFSDERLKGRKKTNLSPFTLTVGLVEDEK